MQRTSSVRVFFLILLFAVSAFVCCFVAGTSCAEGKNEIRWDCPECNILLITVDTIRADHLPCYGYEKNATPSICALSEKAVRFENAYSQAPSTMPALRAIMSGGLVSNEDKKDIIAYYENRPFLAQILKKKGYVTAGFSDHRGIGRDNKDASFNTYHGKSVIKGFDHFRNYGQGRGKVTSHILTQGVLDWMDKNHDKKFFLWAHYFDPHFNYNPLPEYENQFGFRDIDGGRIHNGIDTKEIRKIESSLTKNEVDSIVSLYDAELFYTDFHFGKVLKRIDELKLGDRTVIFIVGDHGEEFMERTRIGHERTLYNELIHVPLIVKLPHSDSPRSVKDSIATKDIFNLVLNMVSERDVPLQKDVISRTNHYYKKGRSKPNDFCLISGPFKYVYNPHTGKEAFFDLKDDPGEVKNRLDHPEKKNLEKKLKEWIEASHVKSGKPSKEMEKISEETDEKLRSLGYAR